MQRAVKVMIPGAHFPTLTPAEQAVEYEGTAMEFDMNHKSLDGTIRRGVPHPPHVGEGICFVCESDSIDDPDHGGLWTTLKLWNRWSGGTTRTNMIVKPRCNFSPSCRSSKLAVHHRQALCSMKTHPPSNLRSNFLGGSPGSGRT